MRFKSWSIDDSTSLSARTAGGCGIYILIFADGEEYVGQTRNLLSRFTAHRRRWPSEIVSVQFSEVPPERLDEAERDVIAMRVRDGARLRNIDLIGLPLRSPELDHYVDPVEVQDWLDGDPGASNIGDRGILAKQRAKTRPRFDELSNRADYDDIRYLAAAYIFECIPYPHRTEHKIWVVTSLPATGQSPDWRRLAVVSINNVEVLVIGEEKLEDQDQVTCGYMNLAPFGALPDFRSDWVTFEEAHYGKTGKVTRVFFDDLQALSDLLSDGEILESARRLAVGLLRKGGGMFKRFHDFNLADDLFMKIEEFETRSEDSHERLG